MTCLCCYSSLPNGCRIEMRLWNVGFMLVIGAVIVCYSEHIDHTHVSVSLLPNSWLVSTAVSVRLCVCLSVCLLVRCYLYRNDVELLLVCYTVSSWAVVFLFLFIFSTLKLWDYSKGKVGPFAGQLHTRSHSLSSTPRHSSCHTHSNNLKTK